MKEKILTPFSGRLVTMSMGPSQVTNVGPIACSLRVGVVNIPTLSSSGTPSRGLSPSSVAVPSATLRSRVVRRGLVAVVRLASARPDSPLAQRVMGVVVPRPCRRRLCPCVAGLIP